jgi:hypothetical protein
VGGGIHAALTRDEPATKPQASEVTNAARATGTNKGTTAARDSKAPAVATSLQAFAFAFAPAPPAVASAAPVPDPATTAAPLSAQPAPAVAAPRATAARDTDTPVAQPPTPPTPPTPLATVSASAAVPLPLPTASAPVASVSSLQAEARLLREADRALKGGDAAGCLQMLDEHARQFPAGVLEPERSAERVLALCAAGRAADAQHAARTFLATHEAGPQASRVRASCGGGGI